MNPIKDTREYKMTAIFESSSGETFILPYGHFLGARLTPGKIGVSPDQLFVSFAAHTVLIEGDYLHLLLKQLRSFDLPTLRVGHETTANGLSSTITNIEVFEGAEASDSAG